MLVAAVSVGVCLVWPRLSSRPSVLATIEIEDIKVSRGHLYIYVKNTGQEPVKMRRAHVDNVQYDISIDIPAGESQVIALAYTWTYRTTYHIKLVTAEGISLERDCSVLVCEKNMALRFNGLDDYVEFTDLPVLDLKNFTVELWVNLAEEPDERCALLCKGDGTSGEVNYMVGVAPGPRPWAGFYDDEGAWREAVGEASLSIGEWHQVAFSFSRPCIAIYVDGVRCTYADDWDFEPKLNNGSLFVGKAPGLPSIGATIDEVKVYSRALSENEVRASYRGKVFEDDLSLWLRFDEGEGYMTWDSTQDEHSGLINGAVWVQNHLVGPPRISGRISMSIFSASCRPLRLLMGLGSFGQLAPRLLSKKAR